ncbi:lipopolysaccharide biosynthesis protein [Methanolobus chelungpuianus]|uniref:lipopolysaccharide biosynthesis protein n=1 Tax=Methanolobus chelungpuianus TaxID=502115 RepID=UPI0021156E55
MSLTKKTIGGFVWTFIEQFSNRGISIVVTLLLAYFLTPDDYGLVAMMAVFLAVANSLMDMGFNQALIRKQDATEVDFSTAFYVNFILGIVSYLLLFISAPLIAAYYNETPLTLLLRAAGIVIIINSFQFVPRSVLTRDLNFKTQLKATVPATFISGLCAVIMAYAGFGVWALITQTIVSSLIITILLWSMSDIWKPTFSFSWDSLSEMFDFGSKLFVSGFLDIIFKNIYVIFIAKLFSTSIAGHYFFATKIKDLILLQLVDSIQKVTYPSLSTVQDDDIRLKAGYRKIIQVTTFVFFPVITLTAALAEPLLLALFSEKWLPAVPYLQLMCIAGLIYPLNAINVNMLKVKGRSDIYLRLGLLEKFNITVILIMSSQFGVIAILIGQIIASVLSYLPNSYYSGKLINYTASEQLKDIFPGLCLSGSIALVVFFALSISTLPVLIELPLLAATAAVLYIAIGYAFKMEAVKIAKLIIADKLKKTT